MPEREKVMTGLELCTNISPDGCLMLCPYKDEKDETYSGFCEQVLKQDALALLKEREVVKPKSKVRHGANAQIQHFCGNCNSMLHGKPKYCSECGKGVLW